ncbi:hypothetical protein KXV85_003969, partial [Aspergillus fumigatus]
ARRPRRLRSRDRDRDREGRRQAQDLPRALCGAEAGGDHRLRHVLDLDHAPCRRHRPARTLHRHSLHESGAGDGAGRADPRHRHQRRHLRDRKGFCRQARQAGRGFRGFPGLHRQPHPAADDQRGDLRAAGGHRDRGRDRCRHEARLQSSDRAAGAGRSRRPRHHAVGHGGLLQGLQRPQIP